MQWSASITGNPGYESLIGDAVVTQMSGDTAFTATINLRGDTYLAVRPWHVHFGNCASGGGIVGDEASYSALSIGIDGTASSAHAKAMSERVLPLAERAWHYAKLSGA